MKIVVYGFPVELGPDSILLACFERLGFGTSIYLLACRSELYCMCCTRSVRQREQRGMFVSQYSTALQYSYHGRWGASRLWERSAACVMAWTATSEPESDWEMQKDTNGTLLVVSLIVGQITETKCTHKTRPFFKNGWRKCGVLSSSSQPCESWAIELIILIFSVWPTSVFKQYTQWWSTAACLISPSLNVQEVKPQCITQERAVQRKILAYVHLTHGAHNYKKCRSFQLSRHRHTHTSPYCLVLTIHPQL